MLKTPEDTLSQKRRVQSIEVGFRVIRVLQTAHEPMALRDIAQAADMPPSKAHLYLTSFMREGLVAQNPQTARYALGPYATELGLSAIRQLSVVEAANAEMAELTAHTGCATYLSVLTEFGPAIVSKVDGSRQGAFTVRLGHVLPMTTSATGLVFLAFLPEPQTRQPARASRQHAIEAADAVKPPTRDDLATVRQKGYATTSGLINANFAAISAPIFDYSDAMAAALTLLGPDKYLAGERLQPCIDHVLDAAARISAKIGGRVPARS
ncbi:IclR family transcriptional regulator [Azospirillum sp. B4]|uniref:IclR family transcriptional regulator n=1 Tax=Azospirillum sp. B4 TaxID=95605 RepID=UPI00034A1951|nr:IclR family transcriptional regulator [Azospirillum sp. B4]